VTELSGRKAQIVAAARGLLESGGSEAVTMRAIADKLGIKAPSLYKHFADKSSVEAALVTAGFIELTEAFAAAGSGSAERLVAGVSWLTHIAMDRTAGYHLRAKDGWQRD
jgi:AcrR family transcriptional regulator